MFINQVIEWVKDPKMTNINIELNEYYGEKFLYDRLMFYYGFVEIKIEDGYIFYRRIFI